MAANGIIGDLKCEPVLLQAAFLHHGDLGGHIIGTSGRDESARTSLANSNVLGSLMPVNSLNRSQVHRQGRRTCLEIQQFREARIPPEK